MSKEAHNTDIPDPFSQPMPTRTSGGGSYPKPDAKATLDTWLADPSLITGKSYEEVMHVLCNGVTETITPFDELYGLDPSPPGATQE